MTNVEKLEKLGILGTLRMRLGASSEDDGSFNSEINSMSNNEIVRQYCAWYLGVGDWWDDMKKIFDQLEEMQKEEE